MADIAATNLQIGPADDGKPMLFADFQRANPVPGYGYELEKGVIRVTDIPGRAHALVLQAIERQLNTYDLSHPGVIHYAAGGAGAKLELPGIGSERHPDRSLYLTPMPEVDYPWDQWVPAIVIEVVSPGEAARVRDYQTKRDEYLRAGVLEYWIVDPETRTMLALVRHGDTWREFRLAAGQSWMTRLLPGFALELARVFGVLDRPT